MKKSELRTLIREQVKAVLKEAPFSSPLAGTRSGGERYSDKPGAFKYTDADPVKFIDDYIANGSKGDLRLDQVKVTKWPDKLKVIGGDCWMNDRIPTIPAGVTFKGRLIIWNCQKLKSLPDNLKVTGDLVLSFLGTKNNSQILVLPNNLFVGGNLLAYSCRVTTIGTNTIINGDAKFSNSKLTEIPKDLKVKGELDIYNTPIEIDLLYRKDYSDEQVKKMFPGVNKIH
jgi:hypothetical protein